MDFVSPVVVADAHARAVREICSELGVDPARGLDAGVARARLAVAGRNELTQAPPVPAWRKFLAQFESPLVLLLIAAGGISIAVWYLEQGGSLPYEALTILAIVLLNALLGFYQEARAAEAVASLRRMTAATASVLRGGERLALAAAELVPGDVLLLEEGATVPADARVIESVVLQTGEAALTGESVPVLKENGTLAADTGIADRVNMVFAGTTVTYGHGRAIVTATGMRAEMGRIAGMLHAATAEATPLQQNLDRLGKILGVAVIAIAVVVAGVILLVNRDHSTAALVGVLLYTVSLAVSAVPEGLAAVTTVVLSLGMQRMAKRNAIVRRLSAVETLGSATVIASDKTGTLTRNEMTVRAVLTASGRTEVTGSGYLPEGELRNASGALGRGVQRTEVERVLAAGALANNAELVQRDGQWIVLGDPTEGALKVAALKAGIDEARISGRFERVAEIPFSSERKLMSTAHADAHIGGQVVLFSKGAPDLLLARCALERRGADEAALTDAARRAITREIEAMAGEALRLLGLAYRRLPEGVVAGEGAEEALVWLGVVGMIDPPRAEAARSVRMAQRAGIRVLMITGDHPAAAAAIAAELGIAARGEPVLSGADLARLSPPELAAAVATTAVYARVAPEHKLAIVRALKANGEIVAMTGDGVNDAPALKAADIGIAMGIAGTDVAKDAADVVLADDNFATIVAAIEEGRAIYANIQKFLRYLLSTNMGEVAVMFFGVALAEALGIVAGRGEALVLPLLPTMILWVNLVTDGFPALAVGVDPPDAELMGRRPRATDEAVVTRRMWAWIGVAAVVMGVGTLLVLDAGLPGGLIDGDGEVREARTMAFHTLVLFQLFGVFCIRSDTAPIGHQLFANRWLWLSLLAALGLQAAVLGVPALRLAFGTTGLSVRDWLTCLAVASTIVLASEIVKAMWRRVDRRAAMA
ncbi:MAG: cation-translocating P-type ATPase [Betaproteobacteria bacterium]|nr:cation-translocating P-type ATPase [Betaproteobacteria bacterium]